MTVSTFVQPNSEIQPAAVYPGIVDGAIAVMSRIAAAFAPHERAAPDMTITLDAGHLMTDAGLVEVAAQATAAFVAPVSDSRIDRVVISRCNGIASIVQGSPSATPVAPAIPAGSWPIAQVLLDAATTVITNADITDERDFSSLSASTGGEGGLLNIQRFGTAGTSSYTPTPGTTKVIVEMVGGGGGGGGCAATDASTGAAASGGGAGAYAKALLTSDFADQIVTVGAGGARSATGASNGNAGTASSFGSTVIAPGGTPGTLSAAWAWAVIVGSGSASALSTGGNLVNSRGAAGGRGFIVSPTATTSGEGGATPFGGGAPGLGSAAGVDATSAGGGGSGAPGSFSSAARSGGAGAAGLVLVYEYA